MAKCNCGGKHTDHPNLHTHWCDVVTKTSPSILTNMGMLSFKKRGENLIGITHKPDNLDFGEFDYRYTCGQFKSGVYKESVHAKDVRTTILQCIEFYTDAVNDDRIWDMRKEAQIARKKWEDDNSPPPVPHNMD